MKLFTRAALVASVAIASALPAAAQQGTLTIGSGFGPSAEVPDPRAAYNGWTSNQVGVTETLMGIDYELNLFPRLAESVEQVEPTTWQVTLRDGVTFHDGTPLTAEAVVASIEPILEEGNEAHNARIASLLDLAGMSTDGDSVVIFETNAPNAAFPWSLSEPGIAILGAPSEDFPINATGPFVFREAVVGQSYRAEANVDYRLGTPALEEVVVVYNDDEATTALAFEAGEVDMVINYPVTDLERIMETGAESYSAPTSRLFFYTVNASSGPMADPLIRRAVSMAIDRPGVVEAVLSGVGGQPASTMFPDGMGWAADIDIDYDPAAAEALLAEAGAVKDGGIWTLDGEPLEIDIVTYTGRAQLSPTAELTQAFLQAIGVQSNVRIGEWGAMTEEIAAGNADLFLQAWNMTPQGDPGGVLETLLTTEGGSNSGRYSNAELDALLADGRTTFDPEGREEIFDRVQEIIAAEAALIPVFHVSQVNVAQPGLSGYSVHPGEVYWVTHETSLAE
ncbi:MAG: ABC transporter substrate-binding protein [Pseudomonadota bacterium]